MQSRFSDIKTWVNAEAQFLRDVIETEITFMEKTSYSDIVTKYDKAVENSLKSRILCKYPRDCVVGEESETMVETDDYEYVWYIDPIDGTTNFVYQKNNFAISVACFHRGQCVLGVVLDVPHNMMYHACHSQGAYKNQNRIYVNAGPSTLHEVVLCTPIIQDVFIHDHSYREFFVLMANEVCAVRSIGCVSLELCLLAEGKASMFIAMGSRPWDHNAAALIVREAGGFINSINKDALHENYSGSIVAFSNSVIRNLFYKGIDL